MLTLNVHNLGNSQRRLWDSVLGIEADFLPSLATVFLPSSLSLSPLFLLGHWSYWITAHPHFNLMASAKTPFPNKGSMWTRTQGSSKLVSHGPSDDTVLPNSGVLSQLPTTVTSPGRADKDQCAISLFPGLS